MKIPVGLARKALVLKKNSPDVLFVTGVVGAVGSTVLACRSTLKLSETLEKAQRDIDLAEQIENPEYTDQDKQHDLMVIRVRTVVEIGKLYAPSVILGVVSVAALTKSHTILKERNAALTAAYVVLERGFNEYRQRVIDRYGEDTEREIRFPREKIKEDNPATGREHTVEIIGENGASIYAKWFDNESPSWEPDPEINLIFLKCQQNYCTDLLRARGHLFLNEVYDMLGIPRTSEGAVVGWFLDGTGDGFVDFGIWPNDEEKVRQYINGRGGSLLLDFNVDGLIYDKLNQERN